MSVLMTIITVLFLLALAMVSYTRISSSSDSMFFATAAWSKLLPLMAICGFSVVIIANLVLSHKVISNHLFLNNLFSIPELIILLVLSSFFTTRLGQSIAALCTSLILLRIGFRPIYLYPSGVGVSLLLMCSVTVLVLGDGLPWLLPQSKEFRSGHVLRSILLAFLCAASIIMTLLVLYRLPDFCLWLERIFARKFPESLTSALLCTIVIVWALISLDQMRQPLLLLMTLPSILLFAFVFGWTAPYLIALLTLTITTALATRERRTMARVT